MNDAPKSDRTWLYVGITFAVLWGVFLVFFNAKPGDAPLLQPPEMPLPVDFGWALQDLDGKPVGLGSFRGRPIVLNLWATWCPPCREEMPSLVRLAADPRLKDVAFVAVTDEDATPQVKGYAASEMKGLTVLRSDTRPVVFSTDGIPATFVIDRDGRVVSREVGAAKWDDPSVVALLEKLLKAAPAPARP